MITYLWGFTNECTKTGFSSTNAALITANPLVKTRFYAVTRGCAQHTNNAVTCINAAITAVHRETRYSPGLTLRTRPEPQNRPKYPPSGPSDGLTPRRGLTRPTAGFNPSQAHTARHSPIPDTATLRVLPRRGPGQRHGLPVSRPWYPATGTRVFAGHTHNQPSIRPAYAAPECPAQT